MWRLTAGALAPLLFLVPLALVAHADEPEIRTLVLDVAGEPAEGIYALPAGEPVGIVVFGHGLGHNTSSWRNHVLEAASHGVVAVAMDYPLCFDLDRSADETVAAAVHFQALYPNLPTYLLGVSMGGAASGMAVADTPYFDWWVDVEGVSMLAETWAEATAVGHYAARCIEEDAGGTPLEEPMAYRERSPALRAHEMKAHGLRGAIVVHALNDGTVPYDQGREMTTALAANGIPVDFYTILRGACAEQGTTGTGALLGRALPDPRHHNPPCLAGHATESSSTHVVMRTGLDALWDLVSGARVPDGYREVTVDEPRPWP